MSINTQIASLRFYEVNKSAAIAFVNPVKSA